METTTLKRCCVYLLLITGMIACKKEVAPPPPEVTTESFSNSCAVPVSWFKLEQKLIKESPGFAPPVAARAIAYTGIALHEAVVWGIYGVPTLKGQLDGLTTLPTPESGKRYIWAIAANSAMADIIRYLFPNASPANLQLIDQQESNDLTSLSDGYTQADIDRSTAFGKQIAAAIYQWSAADGGKDGYLNNFPTDYTPPVGPGLWVPTPPGFQRAMLPYWGNNRLLVKPDQPDLTRILPPPYSTDTTSAFYQSANGVYKISKTLTPEQNTIAKYWADGSNTFTPPGHLIGIAVQLVSEQHLSLGQAASLLAKVGIGLNDAGIICWKYKYKYNVLRPVTYIRNRIDTGWNSLIGTPPFPAYTSGHATFSSAVGHILEDYFGHSFAFTDKQKIPDGFTPRYFDNFNAMIDEAAISRVYGGIHYDFDSENGKQTGKELADHVLSLRY
ncbi:MAG TPA: vanadium-dependent haloperoxidase [Chitinophaga sp.]|uniref:vanadium-dependent haloperoxidase n=1 Tax=Chitinophaga sp. TaxID=1869181 RepID=UPI002D119E39|nr:vanadium-dependent haloperoxidase [Chitinophaga sp.]HVI45744.1 vanadium-dependent haloperoxidase [Chitinophaga sp.]